MFLYLIFLTVVTVADSKVCKSLDVRNTPDHISEFRDCRVIQGSLQVVLMEVSDDATDYIGKNFTELVEITDYLIVYRIMGLTSLRTIFPKLTTIKGEKLFFHHSLVLYDLRDLEEIGLPTLRKIGRGKIRIDSCLNLCYVDTLNWTSFGISDLDVDYDRPTGCDREECPRECGGYCWNNYECQTYEKDVCDDACVGCTVANSPKHCQLCKYYNNSGTCVRTCPSKKVVDQLGNCIKPSQCVSQKWSLFKNTCVKECPLGYKRTPDGKCVPSHVCAGMRVTNQWEFSQMVGCIHVDGPLEFALDCSFVSNEDLEKAFGSVETISEYLKITRSHSITSLSFFKKLRKIEGKKLWSGHYSIFVNQNLNLQKLFPDHFNISIERGEALIQENPNLCPSEAGKLTVKTLSYENGEETTCNLTVMTVKFVEKNPTNVTLEWDDDLQVSTYVVYYIRERDYDGLKIRDDVTESEHSWKSVFVTNSTVFLQKLNPFTRYCYYIKTVENKNQTSVECFRTATGDPSEPLDFKLDFQIETTIVLSWKPPIYLNGELSHYELAVYTQRHYSPARNYCLHPMKEQKCSCPAKEVFFTKDSVCLDKSNPSCEQVAYLTDKLRIKRSLSDTDIITNISEYRSNDTWYTLANLTHFTLYTFFLKACNKKDGDENYHCGGSEMIFQRTEPEKIDPVSDVTVTNNTVSWKEPENPNPEVLAYKIEIEGSKLIHACVTGDKCCKYGLTGVEPGKYKVRVAAVTLAGTGDFSDWENFYFMSHSAKGVTETAVEWGYGVLVFIAVVLVVGAVLWRRYKRRAINVDNFVTRIKNEREDEWKLDDDTVEIIRELGQNSIGVLYRNK